MLMKLIGEQYTWTPFYGVARMTAWLSRAFNESEECKGFDVAYGA